MFEQVKDFINPSKKPDLTLAHEYQRKHLPTLWLIGKTGAGKSSFIQAVTGEGFPTYGGLEGGPWSALRLGYTTECAKIGWTTELVRCNT